MVQSKIKQLRQEFRMFLSMTGFMLPLDYTLRLLCPQMSGLDRNQAARILGGERLLQHDQLPVADYSLPRLTHFNPEIDKHSKAVYTLSHHLFRRCYSEGTNGKAWFQAIAATQAGIPYPLIVAERGGKILLFPSYRQIGSDLTVVLESCESILAEGNSAKKTEYLAEYPLRTEYSFQTFDAFNKKVENKRGIEKSPFWWRTDLVEELGMGLHSYIHEKDHLDGKTAADGRMIFPYEVPNQLWTTAGYGFLSVFKEEAKQRILDSIPSPDSQCFDISPEGRCTPNDGKRIFIEVLKIPVEREEDDLCIVVPDSCRGFRSIET